MSDCVRYPAPGCVVEYLEGNAVQIALVTEEVGGRLRLLLPNRKGYKPPRLMPGKRICKHQQELSKVPKRKKQEY